MLTRCPHCQTTFRVTEDLLQQAGGKVRCGQCQEIFDGRTHLMADDGEPTTAPPAKADREQEFAEEDMEFIDLSATPPPAAPADEDTRKFHGGESQAESEPDVRFNDLDALGPISIPGEMDSSLKVALPEEDSILDEKSAKQTWSGEFDEFAPEAELEDVDRLTAMAGEIDKQREEERRADTAQEQDLFTPLAEDDNRDNGFVIEPGEEPEPGTPPVAQHDGEREAQPASESNGGAQGIHIDDAVPYALRQDLLKKERPARHWSLNLLYAVLALVLIAGLLGQAMMFRSTELAYAWPHLRPAIRAACEQLPCLYTGPRDVAQITLVNRDVRSHPGAQNALLISATLINNADFRQPYPEIRITLSDLSGTVVAKRLFHPEEYLERVYNRFVLMEPQTPVHIDIAVLDPGDDAVNFEFEFR